ncbi:L-dopachrome tautomerase yellow-f2-like [Ostrinia nubilalis]|uniref:L-dopachrome tautomerase yellow-f2-like n=1 Tax=Ostrinia nubilalis TaxID=29057 RepID=UPI003082209A
MYSILPALTIILAIASPAVRPQRMVNKFQEVYAWKQLTFNINGVILDRDRDSPVGLETQSENSWVMESSEEQSGTDSSTQQSSSNSDANRFFIQYNNVPMGMERVGNRLFVTIPRRRYGIPSSINYIDLDTETSRSPALKPYPDIRMAQNITSVYRTRADSCGRLWAVDTGRLELAGTQIQVQTPSILIFDLNTNQLIHRYTLKASDLPAEDTPTGLASITVDITNNNCADAYAYIPDLTSFGVIVYSLRENDSWRHTHNYFSFNPLHGALDIADQRFSWRDGIFSITLLPGSGNCKTAYFHPLIGTDEFAVSTCVLKNKNAMSNRDYFTYYYVVGNRGDMTQSTMHDYHPGSRVIFYAEIGRDAVSCWNSGTLMRPSNIAVLARERVAMSYPSDLHVTGDEVWVMANTLPRFGYSRFNTNDYNFFIYRANVLDAIAGTICSGVSFPTRGGFDNSTDNQL